MNEPTVADVKKFNKNMVTRILPTVNTCGHKIDVDTGPTSNCMHCWLSWMNSSAERVQIWTNVINNGGELGLISTFGKKKIKWFRRYLVAVGELKRKGMVQ